MESTSIQPGPDQTTLSTEPALADLRFIWLEITEKCNLTCTHCYADSGPRGELQGAMSHSDWLGVIDEAAALGCRQLQFIGGEPTLHPHISSLLDHASRSGFDLIEVFTNATHLSHGLIDCMRRLSVRVAASFYSDDQAVHERITNKHGSWRRTVTGLESILTAGIPLRVGIIEMAENEGQLERTTRFLGGLGVTDIGVDHLRGVGRGDLRKASHDGEKTDQLCGQCWKGKLCVTSSGNAFPCVFARQTMLGNVKRQPLADVVTGATLGAFRRDLREIEMQRAERNGIHANCYPNDPCRPQLCQPDLQCSPQGPHCEPDRCQPGLRCSPDL